MAKFHGTFDGVFYGVNGGWRRIEASEVVYTLGEVDENGFPIVYPLYQPQHSDTDTELECFAESDTELELSP